MKENKENLKPVAGLQPFRKFCMSIGELPASYLETMTYYEMLVWFTEYMRNTVIPTINNNAECIDELQNKYIEFTDIITTQQENYEEHITALFNELQTFVNDYFDNLDVQEEINNKLDEMVEQGVLQEIIADYLNSKAVFGYNNVSEMKLATNLIDGSYAKTLGFYSIDDKGGAIYKIREKTNDDVIDESTIIAVYDNTLVAELIEPAEVSVKQLGAKGDGITDDTNIFKLALEKFKNIYVPTGKYIITDTLFLNSWTQIRGDVNTAWKNRTQNYNYGSTILFEAEDTTIPCISFIGKDTSTNTRRKDVYHVTGSQLDGGQFEATVDCEIKNINLVSSNYHNVGCCFGGGSRNKLSISCYGFIVGIIAGGTWGSKVYDSFTFCPYGMMILEDTNDCSFENVYCDCLDDDYSVSSDNTLLYALVTNTNILSEYRNNTSGIITMFTRYILLKNVICEHFAVGFNFGGHSYNQCIDLYGEYNGVFMVSYTGNINILGCYMFTTTTGTPAIVNHLTSLVIENIKCSYSYMIREHNNYQQRYGRYYVLSNIEHNDTQIQMFDSSKPDVIYLDSVNGDDSGSGMITDPVKTLTNAMNRINENGKIYFLSDYTLETNNNYITISKAINFECSSSNPITLTNETSTSIYPIRYLKDISFTNIKFNIYLASASTGLGLRALFNPFTTLPKTIAFNNCEITTNEYTGIFNAMHGSNTYTNIVFNNSQLKGSCIITQDRYRDSTTQKLFIKEYSYNTTAQTTKVYGSNDTSIVESYSN